MAATKAIAPEALRDWFAGVSLAGSEVTAEADETREFYYTPVELAARAYAIADAMLRERAK